MEWGPVYFLVSSHWI